MKTNKKNSYWIWGTIALSLSIILGRLDIDMRWVHFAQGLLLGISLALNAFYLFNLKKIRVKS